jgi:hypothetical protein
MKKLGAVFMVSALALAGIGISYAGFTDEIVVTGDVSTGYVDLVLKGYSCTFVWKIYLTEGPYNPPAGDQYLTIDIGNEIAVYYGPCLRDNPIAPGVVGARDYIEYMFMTTGSGYAIEFVSSAIAEPGIEDDTVTMTYTDIMPCVEYTADFIFHYEGIPAHIDPGWEWGDPPAGYLPIPQDWVKEISYHKTNPKWDQTTGEYIVGWNDNGIIPRGEQIHECTYIRIEIKIKVPQDPAYEDKDDYGFSGKFSVIQWYDCDPPLDEKTLSLPLRPITLCAWIANYGDPEEEWIVLAQITNVPPGDYKVEENGIYRLWCSEQGLIFWVGRNYDERVCHTGMLYYSLDPGIPIYLRDPEWGNVNWILNHYEDVKYAGILPLDIQQAMHFFVNGGNEPSNPLGILLRNDAIGKEGFVPGPGQWAAVIFDENENVQEVFLEVDP